MRRGSSFKAQYRHTPARAATPPSPAWEPLSPVLPPALPVAHPAGAARPEPSHSSTHPNARASNTSALANGGYPPLQLPSFTAAREPSLRSAPLPMPLGSPIEALAEAAITSQRTSPAYLEPSPRASHAATSPVFAHHARERAPIHDPARDQGYPYGERPAKRARSEYHSSPHYGQQHSRPATSHIPGWSYNVEHMVDSGTRMHHDSRAPRPENGDKMLSDAELLLFFSNVSAQTPPAAAKRWSISHPSPVELPPQPIQQVHEPVSPYATAPQSFQHPQTHPPLDLKHNPDASPHPDVAEATSKPQTHTPPDEAVPAVAQLSEPEATSTDIQQKKHHGWPKGKARGPRSTPSASKRKRSTPKPKGAASSTHLASQEQLQSPQSLPADQPAAASSSEFQRLQYPPSSSLARRHSFSTPAAHLSIDAPPPASLRAHSAPLGTDVSSERRLQGSHRPLKKAIAEVPDLICAACNSSDSEVKVGDGEQWIGCDGCKEWYHYACAGFSSEREVRDVNKFYCDPCRPKFGETTKVRKSVRVHTTVDYAGLNEGVLKTSDDNPEHHYISAFKNGDVEFTPETFARMPPEVISSDFLEKTNGFKEPILVPGALNSRPYISADSALESALSTELSEVPVAEFEYETVADDGQDKLDMVIPEGLTVRRVAELYGPNEPVPVIDVKAQEGEGKKWTMGKWADYYEQQGEKPVRNVISLEVSRSRLGKLIRRPKAVRDMDLQDSVWREDDKAAPPPVQFYCLMSVADCFTDFHIDFGGSSVYYHIVKGRKVFFFIPPTKQNLKKYEDWCLSPDQGHDWLGKQVKECYRVDLYPGDTMLIPSGWIHAVWTPEDSLVIGGNFLTRIHYGMQIRVLEIEKNTKVAAQFRYPFFQKIMWLTAIKYLEEDPLPEAVHQLLQSGEQFKRDTPIYCEPNKFGHNSYSGPENYNRRYYSKHELEGLSELIAYLWRTVLISLGKIDLPQKTRAAVTKSIPKGHGEPLILAKRFAMWIAWKRGNETVPSWALPDAALPEPAEGGEKKLSATQIKKLERDAINDALRLTAERSSARIRASDASPAPALSHESPPLDAIDASLVDGGPVSSGPLTGFLRPSANNPHITTPKTSQLGPKRVACDACRKRRIRCKHKDELIDTSKPGMHTIDLSGSYGISVKRRLSDHSVADGQSNSGTGPVNGGPIMADVNGDPYALKSGRVKACADCRKSKRRCIHDEYGNVDPIKANEVPIPRGSASKKRRISDEDGFSTSKRFKHESSYDEHLNGHIHTRHSLPTQLGVGSALLQDIAFSAQALAESVEDDLVPVDPALQAYASGAYSAIDMAPMYAGHDDSVISSIEHHANGDTMMEGVEYTENGEPHGPSVEPLTPGPPPNNAMFVQTNGYAGKAMDHRDPVRHPSSPVSPRYTSAISPSNGHNPFVSSPITHDTNNYTFTANPDLPPPVTPVANHRSSRNAHSSGAKSSKTPNRASRTPKCSATSRRADTKDGIKMETGFDLSMLSMDMIDPNLDQASIELIKQLQQEEHGLRRRSR